MTTKSTAGHTPGPWHRNIKPASKYPTIFAGRNTHVAVVQSLGLSPEQVEANCDLIAAAPETAAERDRLREENASLQEALEHVISEVSWFIKRKKNLAEIVVVDNGVKVWADVLDEDLDIARAALARKAKAEGRS